MKPKYIQRTVQVAVLPPGYPLFSEMTTTVSIEDEAGGEFIKIRQQSGHVDADSQAIQINDRDEWGAIAGAVADLLDEIEKHKGDERE